MNTHPVAETATAAMSRRTVVRRLSVLSFMLLTSSRTEVHTSPGVWKDEDRLVRVYKESGYMVFNLLALDGEGIRTRPLRADGRRWSCS